MSHDKAIESGKERRKKPHGLGYTKEAKRRLAEYKRKKKEPKE